MMKYPFILKMLPVGIGIGALLIFLVVLSVMTLRSQPYPEAVFIGEKMYTLEIASTKEARALGLGGRDSLCETCAMLFSFGVPGKYNFWMKGMRFPLDIAWLSSDGEVVHIERHISEKSQEVYRPQIAASLVLEFNAGALDAVRVGDVLQMTPSQAALP